MGKKSINYDYNNSHGEITLADLNDFEIVQIDYHKLTIESKRSIKGGTYVQED